MKDKAHKTVRKPPGIYIAKYNSSIECVCGKCDLILTNRMLVIIMQVEGVAFKLECLLENATVVNTLISIESISNP